VPLRVLFVTTTYPLKKGDAIPGFVADLASHLIRDGSIEVTVLAPHHPGAALTETVDGVHIERFPYALDPTRQCLAYGNGIPDNVRNNPRAKLQIPAFLVSMFKAISRHLPTTDLIHAHWVEPALIASLANVPFNRPLVVTVHSLKPKRSRLHAKTLAAADRVLFNSAYTLSQAAAKGYTCRGEVVYQGYDESLFGTLPNAGVVRDMLNIPRDAQVITAIGRMIEVKGLHILAQATDAILASRPNAHIVIAGDGPERLQLDAILSRAAHHKRVHLPGSVGRQQVAQLLAESDLFVNPGIIDRTGRAEGLGITTIEAMASGLPVVGSHVGGIVETIFDDLTGYLVPPGDVGALAGAVGRLLDDPALRRRMGAAGRAIAQKQFAWPTLAAQVAAIYRAI
jgi:glycosyltransferase involved in cell wall biosynthesis